MLKEKGKRNPDKLFFKKIAAVSFFFKKGLYILIMAIHSHNYSMFKTCIILMPSKFYAKDKKPYFKLTCHTII